MPVPFKPALRALRQWLRCTADPAGVLIDLYYTLTGEFRQEHKAVYYGQRAYFRGLRQRDGSTSAVLLRRNTHRLEKGLAMRPQRPVFAVDYIGETTAAYAEQVACRGPACQVADDPLMLWATDVLHRYFAATGSHPVLDECRARFNALTASFSWERGSASPAPPAGGPPPVSIEAFQALAKRRRSVRWYLQQPVPRDLLDRALLCAFEAPSACNRQPFEFRIYDDPALAAKLGEIPMGTLGFHQNFPCLVILVGKLRNYRDPRDRHVIYIDAALAAMGFQLALECQGLSSCCINWPEFWEKNDQLGQVLGLEPDERAVMFMSVGYPDPTGLVPHSRKKSLDDLRSYNRLPTR